MAQAPYDAEFPALSADLFKADHVGDNPNLVWWQESMSLVFEFALAIAEFSPATARHGTIWKVRASPADQQAVVQAVCPSTDFH